MDYFALGGVIIKDKDISLVREAHTKLLKKWNLAAPLHSTKIRGRRGPFAWLSRDQAKSDAFHKDLESFILGAPIVSISCVIDREGYVARYAEKHPEPWLLCQTAFAILIERSAKYVQDRNGALKIFFEESGRKEDRALLQYMKSLKSTGMPFPGSGDAGYQSLPACKFRALIVGNPQRVKKDVPMVQLADLVLYAMARGGYDPEYPPYRDLHTNRRVIDAHLDSKEIPTRGVKYSCFDTKKARISPGL